MPHAHDKTVIIRFVKVKDLGVARLVECCERSRQPRISGMGASPSVCGEQFAEPDGARRAALIFITPMRQKARILHFRVARKIRSQPGTLGASKSSRADLN